MVVKTKDYIRAYVDATDDGTFESMDALAEFVTDCLYDEFGKDLSELVWQVVEEREKEA